jgi:hypothetical protein
MRKRVFTIIGMITLVLFSLANRPEVSAQNTSTGPRVYLPVLFNNYDPSWQWENKTDLTLTPTPATEPLTLIDNSGRVHIFWDTYTSPRFIYHIYQTGNGWSAPAAIANSLGVSYLNGAPEITPDGVIHILWRNELTPGGASRMLYARFDGSQWGTEEIVATGQGSSLRGSISYDASGNIHALVNDFTHRVRGSGGWQTSETIPSSPLNPPSIFAAWDTVLDRSGGVQYLGYELLADIGYYAYWKSGQFQVGPTEITGIGYERQTYYQVDNGEIHFYYSSTVPVPGGSVTGAYHRCLTPDGTIQNPQALSGQEDITYTIKAAGDAKDRVIFSWTPENNPVIKFAVFDHCAQTSTKSVNIFAPNENFTFYGVRSLTMKPDGSRMCLLLQQGYSLSTLKLLCVNILN